MRIKITDIDTAIETYFGLNTGTLRGPNRARAHARPRQIAFYLARKLTAISYPVIGSYFYRDHTTVIHGQRTIAAMMQTNPRIVYEVEACEAAIIAIVTAREAHCFEAVQALLDDRTAVYKEAA